MKWFLKYFCFFLEYDDEKWEKGGVCLIHPAVDIACYNTLCKGRRQKKWYFWVGGGI